MTRRARVVAAVALLALALPAAAEAHARLVRSQPAKNALLKEQPQQVLFFFNEPVEASFGVIRVFDDTGREIQQGSAYRPAGQRDVLAVALPPGLKQGSYTATYRVVSSDAHPTKGGFVFSVGRPSKTRAIASLPGQQSAGTATRYAFGIDRWLGYAAIGIAVGGLFFLVWSWRPALARQAREEEPWLGAARAFDRRLRVLLGAAVVTGIATSLLALPLEGASASGVPFSGAWSGSVLGDVLDTRFGTLMILRAVAWALLGAVLVGAASLDRRRLKTSTSPELIALAMLPIGSLLISPALAGHARTQSPGWVLFPADLVHLAAMTLWFGGLVVLVAALPPALLALDEARRGPLLRTAVTRFSAVALGAVIAIAVSGTAQAIVEVGTFPRLVETGYGRAIFAKSILFVALVGLGWVNRQRLIPGLERVVGAAGEVGRVARSIGRNVRVEVALIALVLAFTAVVVAFVPPTDRSFDRLAPTGRTVGWSALGNDVAVRYTLDPARKGPNQLNLYLIDVATGKTYTRARGVRAGFDGPGGSDSPASPLVEVGTGHYANTAAELDRRGTWKVDVAVRTPRDIERGEFDVTVG